MTHSRHGGLNAFRLVPSVFTYMVAVIVTLDMCMCFLSSCESSKNTRVPRYDFGTCQYQHVVDRINSPGYRHPWVLIRSLIRKVNHKFMVDLMVKQPTFDDQSTSSVLKCWIGRCTDTIVGYSTYIMQPTNIQPCRYLDAAEATGVPP